MEASYQFDRVSRFAGTNKPSVDMKLSYWSLTCSTHCSYMKYDNLAAKAGNYKQ